MTSLNTWQGNIVTLDVDAIVNAANSSLLGGSGVDGAIHQAAGPELLTECKTLQGCPPGEAKITRGYRLPAKFVIHTVGPVYRDGRRGEPDVLANCYRNALDLAASKNLQSIAFPAISTGVYGYPKQAATRIAVETASCFVRTPTSLKEIIFVCFDAPTLRLYEEELRRIGE